MAYTRRAPKPDLRAMPIKTLQTDGAKKQEDAISTASEPMMGHNPSIELRRILWCFTPLIIALAVASYLDITRGWVVPFAKWLLHLG